MTGIGIEKPTTGNGRSPLDDRLITAAQYTVGVLRGCNIVTSSANLTYKISRGSDPSNVAVGSASDADGNVIFPITDGITVTTVKGDQTNPRIDSIYAVQHNPQAGDADANVVLVVVNGTPNATPAEPAAPAGIAVKLQSFQVPAGATTTSAASKYGETTYSLPYGGTTGVLLNKTDQNNGSYGDTTQNPNDWLTGTIHVSTDRAVRFMIDANMRAEGGAWGQVSYFPKIDGVLLARFDGPRLVPGMYQSAHFEVIAAVTAGIHMVALAYGKSGGDSTVAGNYNAADGHMGTQLTLVDVGVAV